MSMIKLEDENEQVKTLTDHFFMKQTVYYLSKCLMFKQFPKKNHLTNCPFSNFFDTSVISLVDFV